MVEDLQSFIHEYQMYFNGR